MATQVHLIRATRAFEQLDVQAKMFVYHLTRASWLGARIVMRQTSAESIPIFDFIMELYRLCEGDWTDLIRSCDIEKADLAAFLDFSARFLSNLGNYYGTGNQKFIPEIPSAELAKMASCSHQASQLWLNIKDEMYARPPFTLGFPSALSQSAYYPNSEPLSSTQAAALSTAMQRANIWPENVRIQQVIDDEGQTVRILQASIESDATPHFLDSEDTYHIELVRGDHSGELERVLEALTSAAMYANDSQKAVLDTLNKSLSTGDLEDYRASLKLWVGDRSSPIDFVFGFVEPYRDPAGMKAEFEGIVGISDEEANCQAKSLLSQAERIIGLLPWVTFETAGGGQYGPFEKTTFEPPCLMCINTVAYCSSIIFPGINLPNYNDIRELHGFKGFIVVNRMEAESEQADSVLLIPDDEIEIFRRHCFETYYIYVLIHELFGHPTGRLITDNIVEKEGLPLSPLTNQFITTWYQQRQTWNSVFGDLSTTLDECRCELVSVTLMADEGILRTFNCGHSGRPTPEEVQYNLFQQLGCDGLLGLANYDTETETWGSAHSQAHFAMLQWLLLHGDGVLRVEIQDNSAAWRLKVHVDRSKILTCGFTAIREMLVKLHIYRCTADVDPCRVFYEGLSSVSDEAIHWRTIVCNNSSPKKVFVHGNVFLEDGSPILKEYTATHEGLIQSWAERKV